MEDPKMATDGPGVAYEFLWANPYLPGLGYHNWICGTTINRRLY